MARPSSGHEVFSRRQSTSSLDRASSSELSRKASATRRVHSTPDLCRAGSQFPPTWGGHGALPKPPGHCAAFPLGVTRACASVPSAEHPPPHPGSLSMKPAPTRSLDQYHASHTAHSLYPPGAPVLRSVPKSPPRAGRGSTPLSREQDEDLTFLTSGENYSDKDPMIKRLGNYMSLLGPRYKTISKEMIWEKAQRGEMTPFQRRLEKAGGIEAVGGGPDLTLRHSSSAPGDLVLASDSDGKARAAWLAARTVERKRDRPSKASAAR